MAAEPVTNCSKRRSGGSHELLPQLASSRFSCERMLGAIEPQLVVREWRIDEGAVMRRGASANVRAEMRARHTHAIHGDEPLVLERPDHLHDTRKERCLFFRRELLHGNRHELRPRT